MEFLSTEIGVKIKVQNPFPLPSYASLGASGLDVCAHLATPLFFKPLERHLIPTGIFVELPLGYEFQVRPRSGLALKRGLTVLNTPGTIDADYRGEIKIILANLSSEITNIEPGERIAQLVLAKVEKLMWIPQNELSETERADQGFGSTGMK